MPQVCKNCGSSEIDTDATRGGAVCTSCGSVVEDNVIVSELEFAETSAGGASIIGQFVSAEGERHGFASGYKGGYTKDSRQAILDRGKRTINELGSQLRLSQHSLDTALMFYKLAVAKRLTYGRKTIHVIGACVYLVCRTEHTAHLLIDVCDATQVDIFTLGRTFLTLARELCIDVPTIDPSLYIHRFASKLRFGERENEVAMTALRLVARMKRDWMATGRRPSGLCGAALLVAGKLHGFDTKMKDIMRVVRMSSTTILNRLTDFSKCPSSKLTIEEFKRVDLEEEMDPPSYVNARRRTKQPQMFGGDPDLISQEALSKVTFTKNQIDVYMENRKEIKEHLLERQKLSQEIKRKRKAEAEAELLQPAPVPTAVEETVQCQSMAKGDTLNDAVAGQQDHMACDIEGEQGTEKTVEQKLEETDELDIEGLDDDELDNFLLTGEEIQLKTKIWMEEHGEFMVQLKAKEEIRAQEEAEKKNKMKKYSRRTRKEKPVAGSADEAIINMLSEKKLSTKINYDVLKDLTTGPATSEGLKEEGDSSVTVSDERLTQLPAMGALKRSSKFARKLQPKTIQGGRLASLKRNEPKVTPRSVHFANTNLPEEKSVTPKSPTTEKQDTETVPMPSEATASKISEDVDEVVTQEDHNEEDYFEEEEPEPDHDTELSASQLFAKDIGNEEYEDYGYGGYGEDDGFF